MLRVVRQQRSDLALDEGLQPGVVAQQVQQAAQPYVLEPVERRAPAGDPAASATCAASRNERRTSRDLARRPTPTAVTVAPARSAAARPPAPRRRRRPGPPRQRQQHADAGVVERTHQRDEPWPRAPRRRPARRGRATRLLGRQHRLAGRAGRAAPRRRPAGGRPAGRRARAPRSTTSASGHVCSRMPASSVRWVCRSRLSRSRSTSRLRARVDAHRSTQHQLARPGRAVRAPARAGPSRGRARRPP